MSEGGIFLKIMLVVRVLDDENRMIGAYYRGVKLPFIPTIGVKLSLSSSNSLWETLDGDVLDPPIKEIVYNLDDDETYCLFEINQFLLSKFWTRINNMNNSHELQQFKLHKAFGALQAENSPLDNVKTASEIQQKHSTLLKLFYIIVIPASILCSTTEMLIECII